MNFAALTLLIESVSGFRQRPTRTRLRHMISLNFLIFLNY